MMSSTTIDISVNTMNLLLQFGRDGESYEHIIRRLIDESGWAGLDAQWNKIIYEDEFAPLDDF